LNPTEGLRLHACPALAGGRARPRTLPGSESTFATVLAELTLSGKALRRARSLAAQVLREPPRMLPS